MAFRSRLFRVRTLRPAAVATCGAAILVAAAGTAQAGTASTVSGDLLAPTAADGTVDVQGRTDIDAADPSGPGGYHDTTDVAVNGGTMYVNDRAGWALDVLRRSGGAWAFRAAVPTQPGTGPYLDFVPSGEPAPGGGSLGAGSLGAGSLGAGSLGGLTGSLGG
ncbi:hypothetical protein [Tomitella cavernea]|uniref:Uncharacterized protein n=1 Tax=Tomitella cavernea TaxID=1387982 RepID=A0ABP9CNV5_9ACTN|nr:hypothetical protein [Tomitella cavernea]